MARSLLLLLPSSLFVFFLPPMQPEAPVLYVGVRTLPEYLSPALAFTDTERQASDLLFERLVEPTDDAQGLQQYRSRLAERMPRVAPLQREFRIRPGARWSDGQPVTAADVQRMVEKLKKKDWAGRSALWDVLIEPRVEDDPALVRLRLDRGVFEPLSPMSFPILPQTFRKKPLRLDDPDFAKAPVGSGPYLAPQKVAADGRDYLVFGVNPQYEYEGHKPSFAEIRLFAVKNGAKEFQHAAKPMHVWLDVPTDELDAAAKAGAKEVRMATIRRAYFLAVNHRVPALASVDVRRAIAHGIDRETILKARFRAGRTGIHEALNGPYPPQSWAWCPPPRVPATLFNPVLARSKLGDQNVSLTLKYPDDDPRVAKACLDVQAQLVDKKGKGIQLQLVPRSPHQLKQDVDNRAYELAYYHLDYPDDTFAVWPLFDPRDQGKGGANYLGYDDPNLQVLFRKAREHREFGPIRELTHQIHNHLYEQMPLIPLWQLHTHVAFRGVNPGRIDAQHPFANVTQWRLAP